jgi:hypothetical protein
MRKGQLILGQPLSQSLSRHCALRRVARIATTHENIRINEGSHDLRKAPRESTHGSRA